ncbi:hypothetical protein RFI_33344 [Reticulomyxa filosa]|uniref:RRM domain-containing protein n=1 Tax=Reticulomyxa filosa TaxID=46433 RepID=X6LQ85_RETFI|nr:hypothetical protein RFI_33344 [Reticulomyxa filosa]|eukprot:ETO04058.1 hypothetical protein RFI_33344 [Reticulomyxa filosa]
MTYTSTITNGCGPEEDIADIQSELENEGRVIRTVYRSKKLQTFIHIHYKSIDQAKQHAKLRIGFIHSTIINNNIKNIETKEQQSQNVDEKQQQEITYKNEILEPNAAIKLDT